ncbi:hypothetical protein [Fischerella sp. PCC 9605]|uniref:hypothetical protein n=1 Tax=Fischerella sp. PCC 9605 TaxID=1173024 RepID=UPI0012DD9FB0|nr:hypothetical protein [Fischerella sp. PCC 9605]
MSVLYQIYFGSTQGLAGVAPPGATRGHAPFCARGLAYARDRLSACGYRRTHIAI